MILASTRSANCKRWLKEARLIVTEKDAVKIEKLTLRADVPVFALRVAFTLENEKDVWTLLMQRLLVADARVASIPKT